MDALKISLAEDVKKDKRFRKQVIWFMWIVPFVLVGLILWNIIVTLQLTNLRTKIQTLTSVNKGQVLTSDGPGLLQALQSNSGEWDTNHQPKLTDGRRLKNIDQVLNRKSEK